MSPARVAVVGGGRSSEHDVSLASAAAVRTALTETGYEVVALTISPDGRWHAGNATAALGTDPASCLARAVEVLGSVDVVVPVLHGPHGEDGTLAALCDLAGVPCAGSPLRAGAVAMDKWTTKLIAEAVGIRTAAGRLVHRAELDVLLRRDALDTLGLTLPVVVKPAGAGSSHGVTLVRDAADLPRALRAAFDLDDRVLVEERVVGRELDVAVLERPGRGPVVAPVLEVLVPGDDLFDATRKYDGTARFAIPADIPATVSDTLAAAAVRLFDALGCRGVARIDFFWSADGPVLNEVNTMPGMTLQSQVPRMFAAAGVPFADLLGSVVRAALADATTPDRSPTPVAT